MTHLCTRDRDVDRYMAEVSRYPLLSRDEETALAERHRASGDPDAAHKLVVANLRFVVKIAHGYRGYHLNLLDLIQEGNVGLMMAVRRFDPQRGFRLISYAVWWIRARIYEFIMHSWSAVKVGTGRVRRKLFFKLRSARAAADAQARDGTVSAIELLARRFGTTESDIVDMESHLSGRDASLDAPIGEGAFPTALDLLQETGQSQEEELAEGEERHRLRGSVRRAMKRLNDKERMVVVDRLMAEEPKTLQEIGHEFHVSRERARQIQMTVLRKLRRAVVRDSRGVPVAA